MPFSLDPPTQCQFRLSWCWSSCAPSNALVKLECLHHREERHVKVRVELGPKEAAAGQCVVAKCKKPGAVAAKTTVRVRPAAAAAFMAQQTLLWLIPKHNPCSVEAESDAVVLKDVPLDA